MNNYKQITTDDTLLKMVKRFKNNGRPINANFRNLVNCKTSNERSMHLLHAYPAKLLLHIPYFFLANNVLSEPGDTILDPFSGSGTVLFESQLFGREAIGAEANPLARLISSVKLSRIPYKELEKVSKILLENISNHKNSNIPNLSNLEYWFHPHVIKQLNNIYNHIKYKKKQPIKDFLLVCFSDCIRRVSLADPRISVPVRLRFDQYPNSHPLNKKTQQLLNKLKRINVNKVFKERLEVNLKRYYQLSIAESSAPKAEVICSDARNLINEFSGNGNLNKPIKNKSVQLIITSPPYPGAQKYIRASSLNLGWLNKHSLEDLRDIKQNIIGREEIKKDELLSLKATGIMAADTMLKKIGKINPTRMGIASTYLNEMRSALLEMFRVLKTNGYLVLVVANNNIAGKQFRTQKYLERIAEEIGFKLVLKMIDDITSRGLMTKRNKTASIITREWILVFKKEAK